MTVNYPCEVIYRYRCAVCGDMQEATEKCRGVSWQVQEPTGARDGWRLVFGLAWVCIKHQVKEIVEIDGNKGYFEWYDKQDIEWVPVMEPKQENQIRMIEV